MYDCRCASCFRDHCCKKPLTELSAKIFELKSDSGAPLIDAMPSKTMPNRFESKTETGTASGDSTIAGSAHVKAFSFDYKLPVQFNCDTPSQDM